MTLRKFQTKKTHLVNYSPINPYFKKKKNGQRYTSGRRKITQIYLSKLKMHIKSSRVTTKNIYYIEKILNDSHDYYCNNKLNQS